MPRRRAGAVVSSGSCECLNVPCGSADLPQCSGFCENPSEACIFTVTDCSCANIP